MINLNITDQDDPKFIEIVCNLLNASVESLEPQEIYVVTIDHCFDHKWNSFSGVIDLQLGVWFGPLLRLPPFHPNRVRNELYFCRVESPSLDYEIKKAPLLHKHQSSYRNLQRRLHQITPSGLYVWYSSDTKETDGASLMVYEIQGEKHMTWYVSFLKGRGWQVNKTKGITRQEVLKMSMMQTKRTA
jgi:hypothetical protein